MKLFLALALVASVSAYDECPKCRNAAAAAGVSNCAFETTSNCGCNGGCGALDGVNSFRISDCSLDTCADAARRLAETTTDLEEANQATSQWGRRRRRFFDNRRRRRRFFDNRRRRRRFFDNRRRRRRFFDNRRRRRRFFDARRRRRRTSYPTPFPTTYPTRYPTRYPTPHPCDDGSHGCDKNAAGICYKGRGNSWTCGCVNTHFCSAGCAAPHIGHTCTLITAAPTAYPTATPTEFPTASPTPAPTPFPTPSPTQAPTKAPTKTPTKAPTKAPTQMCPVTCKKITVEGGGEFIQTFTSIHNKDTTFTNHECFIEGNDCSCKCN